MEKTLRVLGADSEEGGGHSHSHTHTTPGDSSEDSHATGVHVSLSANGLKSRRSDGGQEAAGSDGATRADERIEAKSTVQPSKLSAYLNLFGDFVHNMCVYPRCFLSFLLHLLPPPFRVGRFWVLPEIDGCCFDFTVPMASRTCPFTPPS